MSILDEGLDSLPLWEEIETLRAQVTQLRTALGQAQIGATLAEAREGLEDQLDAGTVCPCCDQFAKVYRRSINSSMARSLITLWNKSGGAPAYIPDVVGSRSREESKLRYWSLVEEAPMQRSDGGHAGWWRITDSGVDWIHGRVKVAKYAHVYNGKLLRLGGPQVGIADALGSHFDLRELLR